MSDSIHRIIAIVLPASIFITVAYLFIRGCFSEMTEWNEKINDKRH